MENGKLFDKVSMLPIFRIFHDFTLSVQNLPYLIITGNCQGNLN